MARIVTTSPHDWSLPASTTRATSAGSSNSSPAENTPRPSSSSWGVLPKRVTAAIPNVEAEQTCQRGLDEPRRDGKDQTMTQTTDEVLPAGGGVNRAQRDYWETDGPRQYKQFGASNEALLAPAGQAMLDAAQLRPGERVLDVGCGLGLPRSKRRRGPRRPTGSSASTSPQQSSSPPGRASQPPVWTTSS